jgi:hypothetical protein
MLDRGQRPCSLSLLSSLTITRRGGIEAIDYIQAKLSPEEFAGYCRGNALKYVSRAGRKDAVGQEVRKAIWYLERWRDSLVRTDK